MTNGVCVIAGGGLAGLLSSILLADRFERVLLVEKSDRCGGLLRSVRDSSGVPFDLGTHIPTVTMIPELDDILFGAPDELDRNWSKFAHLHSGNYFGGRWQPHSPLIDTRTLPDTDYQRGIVEFLALDQASEATNLDTYLRQTVGSTFTDQIFVPVLKKLYGVEPIDLASNANTSYFGLPRVIALTPTVTNKLKELEVFDAKLGYHSSRDHKREAFHLYPKANTGISFWMDYLLDKAVAKGVDVYTNEQIARIEHRKGRIESVVLTSKGKVDCDFLVWTAPPQLALGAAGLPGSGSRPVTRTVSLFHFRFDKALLMKEPLYLWCWDLAFRGFRITLYPNLNPQIRPPQNNLTIEVLSTPEEADGVTLEEMRREATELALVPENAQVVGQMKQVIHDTFPVPTPTFNAQVQESFDQLYGSFDNIMVTGRFGGKHWFLRDIIRQTYEEIGARFH